MVKPGKPTEPAGRAARPVRRLGLATVMAGAIIWLAATAAAGIPIIDTTGDGGGTWTSTTPAPTPTTTPAPTPSGSLIGSGSVTVPGMDQTYTYVAQPAPTPPDGQTSTERPGPVAVPGFAPASPSGGTVTIGIDTAWLGGATDLKAMTGYVRAAALLLAMVGLIAATLALFGSRIAPRLFGDAGPRLIAGLLGVIALGATAALMVLGTNMGTITIDLP